MKFCEKSKTASVFYRGFNMSVRHLLYLIILILYTLPCPRAHAQWDLDFDSFFTDYYANPWTGSFASGLNGRSGNANTMDINLNLIANRETELNATNVIGNYFYGRNNSTTVNDRAFGQVRRERKLQDPWSLFFQGALEFDRFRDFDYRIALHSGLSREMYRNESGFLKARFGAGSSREVGAPNSEWIPELQIGSDWEYRFTETTNAFAIVDYYPNVSNFSDYRLNTNVGLNFLLDAPRNLSFRIFAMNRYDSTPPPGDKKNDIDYGVALSLGF